MFNKLIGVFIIFYLIVKSEQKTRYDNYKLVKITVKTNDHVLLLKQWYNDNEFDVWSDDDSGVEVLLSPTAFVKYEKLCNENELDIEILNNNIQTLIDKESEDMAKSRLLRTDATRIAGTYATIDQINRWLDMLAFANSAYATSYIAGKTFENRDIKVLKLKTATSKRSIWLDCGIHPREWIAISSCIWFIDRITRDYNAGDAVARDLLNHYEFHIMPVVNPDGYAYSHYMGRLQRKNRSVKEPISWCYGVDLNRNWGFYWNVAGASNDPCSDVFAGYSANDQLETKAIQQIIQSQLGNWDAFITLHSYGNYFMHPFGYGPVLPPAEDYAIQKNVSEITVAAIKSVNGNVYKIGSPYTLLYAAAGGSFDWTYAVAGILHSYCLELTSGNNYGFLWPESQIPTIGNEVYAGLKALFQTIKQ